MDVWQIPYRSANNPSLSVRETNTLLQAVRNFFAPHRERRSLTGQYGSVNVQSRNQFSPLTVIFDEDYPPNSVFATAYLEQSEVYTYRPHAVAAVLKNPNRKNLPFNKDVIYCTNGGDYVKSGAVREVYPIDYTTPRLVKYNGTGPIAGDKCYPVPNQVYVTVNDNGPFLCIGKPDEDLDEVWIIRHERIMEIYGTADAAITYGNTGTFSVWRDLTVQADNADGEFKFLGKAAQTIVEGAGVLARWFDDLNDGAGGWMLTNSNCEAFP